MQLQDYNTGFLVHSPEGCAFRIRYLLHRPEVARRLGQKAKEFVRQHFLITRDIRDYLNLMILCENPDRRVIEFGSKKQGLGGFFLVHLNTLGAIPRADGRCCFRVWAPQG